MIFKPFPIFAKPPGDTPFGVARFGSLRRFTMQQFAQNTAIVATALDRALQQLVDRYNNLQPNDLGRRWVQKQYVFGFSPSPVQAGQWNFPFLSLYNDATNAVLTDGVQNPYRLKGTFNPSLDPTAIRNSSQLVWTNALYMRRQARIIAANVTMTSASNGASTFQNPWVYGDPPPPGKSIGQPLDDMYVDVSIDNRWYHNDAKQAAPEIQRIVFTAESQAFTPIAISAPQHDMLPLYQEFTAYNKGVSIDARNLNIPVPEGAFVRFTTLIPDYDNTYNSGWNNGPDSETRQLSTANQIYSLTLTVLEAMQ